MKKIKGFTLIELVIVMATFSIVLFGALSLMGPIRTIFEKTYSNEEYTAASTNISNYLESELQYAEYVQVTSVAPSTASLRNFLNRRYDGKLTADTAGNAVYASGDVYVLRIDNANGGIISKWDLTYQMGDLDAIGVLEGNAMVDNSNAATFDTLPRYIYYTSDTDKGTEIAVAALPDTDPRITRIDNFDINNPNVPCAINKAFYNDYHFNISLGNVFLNDENKLQWNSDYYNAFGTTPEEQKLKTFGQQNFGFTITAYPFNTQKHIQGRAMSTTGGFNVNIYDTSTSVTTSSVSFSSKNMWDYKPYLQYKWDANATKDARTNEATVEGVTSKQYEYYDLVDPTKSDETAKSHSVAFEITSDLMVADYTNGIELYQKRIEPNVIYIIYTYCGEDILTS